MSTEFLETHMLAATEDGGTVWRARCGMAVNRNRWLEFFFAPPATSATTPRSYCRPCLEAMGRLPVAMIVDPQPSCAHGLVYRHKNLVEGWKALKECKACNRPALLLLDDGRDDQSFAERIKAFRAALTEVLDRRDARLRSARLRRTKPRKVLEIRATSMADLMAARCAHGVLYDLDDAGADPVGVSAGSATAEGT